MAGGRLRRFKAGLFADEFTLKPLGTAAHRRFVDEIRRNFHCSCTVSEKGNLYLQRICSATEIETLSPLKTLHFFSLYLMPHIKTDTPYKTNSLSYRERARQRAKYPPFSEEPASRLSGLRQRRRPAFRTISGHKPGPTLPVDWRICMKRKDIKFSTRMAAEDREAIKELAKQSGMSMSNYVTDCCLGKQIIIIDGLKEVLRELKGIGNNLNQLVMLVHMGKVKVVGLEDVRQLLADILIAVRQIAERKRW